MSLLFILAYIILAPISLYIFILIGRFLRLFHLPHKTYIRLGVFALWLAALALIVINVSITPLVAILYFVALNLLMELVNFVLKRVWAKKEAIKTGQRRNAKSRRRQASRHTYWNIVYKTCVIPVLITSMIITCGIVNGHSVTETDYTVYSEKISKNDGYRICFISDIHLGQSMDAEELKEVLSEIDGKYVDLLLLGGDIFDESTTRTDMEAACKYLGEVKTTFGAYYIYGNHDKQQLSLKAYTGSEEADPEDFTTEDIIENLTAAGITILEDEAVAITSELVLAGRSGERKDRLSVESLMELTRPEEAASEETTDVTEEDSEDPVDPDLDSCMPENAYVIMLDHYPIETEEKINAGVDLTLSGHTHGGQIFPLGILNDTVFSNDYNYGFYQFEDTTLMVSSGMGCWGSGFRTEHRCEYVILDVLPLEEIETSMVALY